MVRYVCIPNITYIYINSSKGIPTLSFYNEGQYPLKSRNSLIDKVTLTEKHVSAATEPTGLQSYIIIQYITAMEVSSVLVIAR